MSSCHDGFRWEFEIKKTNLVWMKDGIIFRVMFDLSSLLYIDSYLDKSNKLIDISLWPKSTNKSNNNKPTLFLWKLYLSQCIWTQIWRDALFQMTNWSDCAVNSCMIFLSCWPNFWLEFVDLKSSWSLKLSLLILELLWECPTLSLQNF